MFAIDQIYYLILTVVVRICYRRIIRSTDIRVGTKDPSGTTQVGLASVPSADLDSFEC